MLGDPRGPCPDQGVLQGKETARQITCRAGMIGMGNVGAGLALCKHFRGPGNP
ncbi:hypothetical protein [Roseovarius sp.]|uniref:hypothetical protein n=1 Tax=Roseovarius sp. TaxID=1486281 RepID=UPI00261CFDC7|nr:hypothetical protein [Roseovarius sp.]MDM8165061.1 hypothetical protein [Roseovarius sp.]